MPLGIEIKGFVKGLNITYELSDETILNTINKESASISTFGNSVSPKSGVAFRSKKAREGLDIDRTVNKFDFKLGVNTYKSQSFLIKNHSGIQTKFKLSLKNYFPLLIPLCIELAPSNNSTSTFSTGLNRKSNLNSNSLFFISF